MKHIILLFVIVAAFITGANGFWVFGGDGRYGGYAAAPVAHLIDREPAAYGDDTVVFDELLHKLSESVERYKTLYDSRKAMIGLLLSYEHGSAKWDEARITLRMMTGELKDIAEEINIVTYQMALLRDKKQEARLTDKEDGTL